MIAILLYLIGLVCVVVTVAFAALDAPAIYQSVAAASGGGIGEALAALAGAGARLNWALLPFLGGLVLMGFARIIMLLGSINRALRGPA